TRRAKVGLKVVKTKDGVDLVITPDAAFLADPAPGGVFAPTPSPASRSSPRPPGAGGGPMAPEVAP
ncbi:hypothetical protein ACWD0E_33630, partial [Streptomyces sp. NPDC003002]